MTNIINISVAKAQQSYAVDFENLPAASQVFVINYGLRQYINDSVAGIKPDDTQGACEAVLNRLAQLDSGTVGIRATVERNPVKAEAMKLAGDKVKTALRAKGIKVNDLAEGVFKANAEKVYAKYEAELTAKAKEILAIRSADSKVDVELDI